ERERAVANDDVAVALEIVVRAEAEVVVLALRRRVDPAPLIARERALFIVAGDDVLAQLGADRLEPVAEVADDREVAQHGVLLLRDVVERDDHEQRAEPDAEPSPHRHVVDHSNRSRLSRPTRSGSDPYPCARSRSRGKSRRRRGAGPWPTRGGLGSECSG